MKLGVDGRELVNGVRTGIGRYLLEVMRAASKDGWDVIVYADRPLPPALAPPGIQVRMLRAPWTFWWDQQSLPRRLAKDRVSVFLSPYYKGPLLTSCPVVLTIHDLMFIQYLGRSRFVYDTVMTILAGLYAASATAIIADSEHTRRSVVGRLRVRPVKVTVIPVAVGPEFAPKPITDATRFKYGIVGNFLLSVGNFLPHKNLSRLLEAYAKMSAPHRAACRLVLAGGDRGRQRELEAAVKRLGIEGRVVFPGLVEEADLPGLYGGCSLFVLPSLEEGFGLPALEAMACGAPVVASNRGAIPEVVGDAALLVNPEDPAAMASAMERVLSSEQLAGELRQRGLARAREFTPDRTAGRVLQVLKQVGGRET
jgi:glycosyltransferase involved in cell wall biosynthesis